MDTNIKVIEAHLSTGKTLPLRQAEAKNGNTYWATLKRKPDGTRVFSGYGVNVPLDMTDHPQKIESIKVDGVGTIKVQHDVTQPRYNPKTKKLSPGGKIRAKGEKEFTSKVDGQKWTLSFRATLVRDDVVNLQVSIHRSGQRGIAVQSEL